MFRNGFAPALIAVSLLAQDGSPRSAVVHVGDVTAPGARTARTAKGIPFQIVVAPADPNPAFQLKAPGWSAPAKLAFRNVRFDGRELHAVMTLENETGSTLQNARLSITQVTEEYRSRDSQGKEVTNRRTLTADMAAPVVFGNLPTGSTSDEFTLTVTGFHTAPETVRTTVHGVVSTARS